MNPAGLEAPKIDQIEHLGHSPFAIRFWDPPRLESERHVLGHAQMGKQSKVLEHHPEIASFRGKAGNVSALQSDGATVRDLEPGQQAQERRLAATARTQQHQGLPFLDLEGQTV
jgi:hypothetical protein